MQIVETIDLDDHDAVVAFLKVQSDRIKELEKREQRLLDEIEDFQELLKQNDNVCYDHVISIIDDKIATIPKIYVSGMHKSLAQIKQAYEEGFLRGLNDLRKELVEDGED